MAAAPLVIAASLFSAGAAVRMSDKRGQPGMPQLPSAPAPIDTRADQLLAQQRALQARTQQNRRSAAPTGRSGTLLTSPGGAGGSAPVQRQTLLGL